MSAEPTDAAAAAAKAAKDKIGLDYLLAQYAVLLMTLEQALRQRLPADTLAEYGRLRETAIAKAIDLVSRGAGEWPEGLQ